MVVPAAAAALLVFHATIATAAPPAPAPCIGHCSDDPRTVATDCAFKKLALAAAQGLQPQRDVRPVFDALQLGTQCGLPTPAPFVAPADAWPAPPSYAIHVTPVDSLPKALAQAARLPPDKRMLVLENGTFFLNETLRIGPELSGLTIRAAINAKPILSGGQLLSVKWAPTTVPSGATNVFSTSLKGQKVDWTVRSLFVGVGVGQRAIRARVPNGDPEINGLHTATVNDNVTGWFAGAAGWLPPPRSLRGNATIVNISSPSRNGPGGSPTFAFFLQGEGGPVSQFVPPRSYWGWARPGDPTNPKPAGGGGKTYTIPGGLRYGNNSMSNGLNSSWADPTTAEVHAFHGQAWGSWVFEVASRDEEADPSTGFGGNLTFKRGGFQEARGCPHGGAWHVEGVLELLDAAREFHYDLGTETLYYMPNSTSMDDTTRSPPSRVVAPKLETIIAIEGDSHTKPVVNVSLIGLTFAHSRPTYLDSYEAVSGGDWSFHRGGAVQIENASSTSIESCSFPAAGGNAVMLNGFVRGSTIVGSDFTSSGDSAIVALGYAAGIDGTAGRQPRGTKISGCTISNVGIYGKQSACFSQAIAMETTLEDNLCFNVPRSGFNFNDHFGGSNRARRNMIFNSVRETGDHGTINLWDRQPYTYDASSPGKLVPQWSELSGNFLINNYHGCWPLCHDDGSNHWRNDRNVILWGGQKSNMGHDLTFTSNLYIHPEVLGGGAIAGASWPRVCHLCNGAGRGESETGNQSALCGTETFVNNSCVTANPSIYRMPCSVGINGQVQRFDSSIAAGTTLTAQNKFFVANASTVNWPCGGTNLSKAQAAGEELGSSVTAPIPADDVLVRLATALLRESGWTL